MRIHPLRLVPILALCAALSSFSLTYAQDGGDKPPTGMTIHVVQRGETLFRIAQRYGTTVEDLAQLNGIQNPAVLAAGQRLLVPSAPVAPEEASIGVPTSYTLQFGDTLFKLAVTFGTTEAAIAARNYITNPRQMYIGQRIALQEGAEDATGIKRLDSSCGARRDALSYRSALQHLSRLDPLGQSLAPRRYALQRPAFGHPCR